MSQDIVKHPNLLRGSGVVVFGSWDTRVVTVTVTVEAPGDHVLVAQVAATDQVDVDSTPGNGVDAEDDQPTVVVTVQPTSPPAGPPQVDLAIAKSADVDAAPAGSIVTFTIVASNDGPDDATGVIVSDPVPDGATFSAARTAAGSYDAQTGAWTIGVLAAGTDATLFVDLVIDGSGDVTNVARVLTAAGDDVDSTPGNGVDAEDDQDSATVLALVPVLEIAKRADTGSPRLGSEITWTLVVRNTSGGIADGAVLRDPTPTGTRYVAGSTTLGGQQVSDRNGASPLIDGVTLPALAVGDSVTVTFRTLVAFAPPSGSIENTATVTLGSGATTVSSNDVRLTVLLEIPRTGANSLTSLSLALATLLVGLFLLLASRRRRSIG